MEQMSLEPEAFEAANKGAAATDIAVVVPSLIASRRVIVLLIAFLCCWVMIAVTMGGEYGSIVRNTGANPRKLEGSN
jgi:hypothetical protein